MAGGTPSKRDGRGARLGGPFLGRAGKGPILKVVPAGERRRQISLKEISSCFSEHEMRELCNSPERLAPLFCFLHDSGLVKIIITEAGLMREQAAVIAPHFMMEETHDEQLDRKALISPRRPWTENWPSWLLKTRKQTESALPSFFFSSSFFFHVFFLSAIPARLFLEYLVSFLFPLNSERR